MAASGPVLYGVIGGSGVYKMDCLTDVSEIEIDTPFGKPSDKVIVASIEGVRCAFIPRHNRNHIYTPSEVPYAANIYALKTLGVKYLLSVTAVGSLQEHLKPGDLVVASQFVDKTTGIRRSTFFGDGCVGHVPMGLPFDPIFADVAVHAITAALPEVTVHPRGVMVTMEGPAFSTKAESMANRAFCGADLIGMTTATESKLAREAEMAHCVVAMVTDMDAWSDAPHVDVATVMKTLASNGHHAQIFTKAIILALHAKGEFKCEAHDACQFAVMTKKDHIPAATLKKLEPIVGRWIN